jgi:hypothetical protein
MKKEPEKPTQHWMGSKFNIAVAQKVGTTSKQRLRWLACDFANYTGDKLEETLLEISVFVVFESGGGALNLNYMPEVPAKSLADIAKEVREGLERFVDGGTWLLKVDEAMERRVTRRRREFPPEQGKLEVFSIWMREYRLPNAAAFRSVFLLTIQDLLCREGAALARCAWHECRNLFVQEDPRQRYCTDSHAHRDRQYRYRTGRTVGETN